MSEVELVSAGKADPLAWVRSQFPAFRQKINSQPAVFFDGPGGTQVPQRVIDAMADYLATSNANCHGAFATSGRTDAVLTEAHRAMADLLGCDAREIVFGQNMTSLTFAMSRAIGRELRPGDEVIVTVLDHDANFAPWKALEERGAVVRVADIREEDCTLDTDGLLSMLNERTKLVAVGYASNSVGSINDLHRVVGAARDVDAWVYVDAVQYAPHGPIDVRSLDCDFLACSAYKFFGPHVGALYGKGEHLERLRPYKVRPAPETIPDRWETGTQNHEGLAGVTAAIDYLAELGNRTGGAATSDGNRRARLLAAFEWIRTHERGLAEQLVRGFSEIPGLLIYGISDPRRFDHRVPTFAIRMEGMHPRKLAGLLGRRGIFVWDGHYYAINLSERLGVEDSGGLLRVGLVHYNTADEVEGLLDALREIASQM